MIRLVLLLDVRFPLSLRNVEDLPFERGIDICHETVRMWWNRFGPLFAGDTRRARVSRMRGFRHWRWHRDEMDVQLNGAVLESYVIRTRDKEAALTFMKKALKRHGYRSSHDRRPAQRRRGDVGPGQCGEAGGGPLGR